MKIKFVSDQEKNVIAVFDNDKDIKKFLNGHDERYIIDEYEVNETFGMKILPCFKVNDQGKITGIFYLPSKKNAITKEDDYIIQAETMEEAEKKFKKWST